MINNLRSLNKIVNDVVNYIIKIACKETKDGSFSISIRDVTAKACPDCEELSKYKEFIVSELKSRSEIIQAELSATDPDIFVVTCNGRYCPQYEWQENSNIQLGMSKESWEISSLQDISQPLDMSRMADIGKAFMYALIAENRQRAELLFKDELKITAEELIRLDLDPTQILGLETINSSEINVEETLASDASQDEEVSWVEEKLQKDKSYQESYRIYKQALSTGDAELANESLNSINKLHDNYAAIRGSAQEDLSDSLIDKAREKTIHSLLEKDHQYRTLKSTESAYLEKYELTYKEMIEIFLPRAGSKYIIQSKVNSELNGRICTIVEPRVLDDEYGFYVSVNDENDNVVTVLYSDLIPYCDNDLIVGRWRIHLVFPGELFGQNNSIINNNETLIEFWDVYSTIEMIKTREHQTEQLHSHFSYKNKKKMSQNAKQEEWHNKRKNTMFSRMKQGLFTNGRYYLSGILNGYKDYFNENNGQGACGLCLNNGAKDSWTVSPWEMSVILNWLKCRPTSTKKIYEVHGEISVSIERSDNQEELLGYIDKKISSVYDVSEICIGPISSSSSSKSIPFSFKTSLNKNGIEPIVKMLLSDYEVDVQSISLM